MDVRHGDQLSICHNSFNELFRTKSKTTTNSLCTSKRNHIFALDKGQIMLLFKAPFISLKESVKCTLECFVCSAFFSILCLPLRAKCHWKYRQAQSAILIPLPCPSHAHSIHPNPTHFHSFTHIPTHTPSFTVLLPVDVPKALPPKEKALR